MTLTLPSSTLVLSLHTTSSALCAGPPQATWLMPPLPRTLRSSTSSAAPPPNASGTTTVAPTMGVCTVVCTAAAATWAWGTLPLQPTEGLLCHLCHRWWWASSHRASHTTPHQQDEGASWWWSIVTLRMGQRGTEERRRMTWWWRMVPLPAITTCTTIRCTMAHQGWTTLFTVHCLMISNVRKHGNEKMKKTHNHLRSFCYGYKYLKLLLKLDFCLINTSSFKFLGVIFKIRWRFSFGCRAEWRLWKNILVIIIKNTRPPKSWEATVVHVEYYTAVVIHARHRLYVGIVSRRILYCIHRCGDNWVWTYSHASQVDFPFCSLFCFSFNSGVECICDCIISEII